MDQEGTQTGRKAHYLVEGQRHEIGFPARQVQRVG